MSVTNRAHEAGDEPDSGHDRALAWDEERHIMLAMTTATSVNLTTFVTILHFCRWCRQHTRHELHGTEMVCLCCADQVLLRELGRD